jgi:hypothetical protein
MKQPGRFLEKWWLLLPGCLAAVLSLVLATSVQSALEPTRQGTKGTPKQIEVGKNVTFEVEGESRRVIVKSAVCLREGPLEGLLTRKTTKEHEYILAADCDARHIHTALILARAKPGSPVVFLPKYTAAHGTAIKVSLRYQKAGKSVTVPAREWIRESKGKKLLDQNWVFGGSRFVPNEEDKNKPPVYLANFGDLICLCNMDTAMLDLGVKSPKKFDDRLFEANTEKIPPRETPVEVILEPVVEAKK